MRQAVAGSSGGVSPSRHLMTMKRDCRQVSTADLTDKNVPSSPLTRQWFQNTWSNAFLLLVVGWWLGGNTIRVVHIGSIQDHDCIYL